MMIHQDRIQSALQTFQNDGEIQLDHQNIDKVFSVNNYEQKHIALQILTVVGGILAYGFFMGMLFLAKLYESPSALIILGSLSIVGSFLLNLKTNELILDTFSVLSYLSGVTLLVFGLEETLEGDNGVIIASVIICVGLLALFITQNFILSFLSLSGVLISIFYLLSLLNFTYLGLIVSPVLMLAFSYFIFNEAKILSLKGRIGRLYTSAFWVLFCSVLLDLTSFEIFESYSSNKLYFNLFYILLFFKGLCYLGVMYFILKDFEWESKLNFFAILFISAVVISLLIKGNAIISSLLLLLLCFRNNIRWGAIIAGLYLIYSFSMYYYNLNVTLLNKSIILMSAGGLIIGLYIFLQKQLKKL